MKVISLYQKEQMQRPLLISSHAEGESFANGETVVFRAVATDDDNEVADLTMVWYIGATTVCLHL